VENGLSDLAQSQNREVHVIAGASGSNGTIKDQGFITIPAQLWKVALILLRNAGPEDCH
jgi:DNA/RNA endonuclease G (NUC1)